VASIRARLAFGYGAALIGTLLAFAVALYLARGASAEQDLAAEAVEEADHVLRVVHAYATQERPAVDFRLVNDRFVTTITQGMALELDRHSGYFFVFGRDDLTLYVSPPLRILRVVDPDAYAALAEAARGLVSEGQGIRITLPDETSGDTRSMLFAMRRETTTGSLIARVVAGVPTSSADLAPQLLVGTLIAVVPVVVILSMFAAFWLAGRALVPVEEIINDVEAISDGRSLHRRLVPTPDADELSRLTMTLNAMFARLEHSFGALRRFTADASHELKTPLAVLRADVERAMNPSTSATDRLVALEEALAEITRTSDLVDSLLTLARADEGRFDLVREPVALAPLVREAFETAAILGEGAELDVNLTTVDEGTVLGDAGRLRQLFLNLVTNAIKYTPAGGRVDVSLARRPQHDEIVFAVRDTGIGIAAGDLPHVFERFWRADQARSRRLAPPQSGLADRGGSGLGLAISQWIAQAHGGTLSVQSRLGRGSVFTVTLPVKPGS
jgi:two-component system OmpR family sensor kinase